ncbi:MAG: hypothetical protein ACI9S9_003067 [Planctomycetota bacterium]|jgi:hypothetical protein
MNKLQLIALASSVCLGSCVGTGTYETWRSPFSNNVHKGVVLATASDDDGSKQTWRVYPGNNGNPRVELSGHKVFIVPKLGVFTASVTRERAESFGTKPFRGVWIKSVVSDKPAALAGITAEQIVLKVNGQDVNGSEQFHDMIASIGVPGEPLDLTVLSKGKPDDHIDTERPAVVSVAPYGAKSSRGTTDSIRLENSMGVQRYTGMQAALVKQELANTLFGALQDVTLITGVVPGSPAYHAGLRAGDRILKLDGQPNPSLQDVRNAVLDRLQTSMPAAETYDLARDRKLARSTEDRSDAIQLQVDGPLGIHDTSMSVAPVGDRNRFYVPIVIGYEFSDQDSRVNFLNFMFQFGFNYSSNVHESNTRKPVVTSDLSILPLGMFGVKHGLHRSEYRLFWLIEWTTENYSNVDHYDYKKDGQTRFRATANKRDAAR